MYDMPAIPEFLKRVSTPTTPTNVTPPTREWVMPQYNVYKERRADADRKKEILDVVRCLMRDQMTTIAKVRNKIIEAGYDFTDYEIKSGLIQLTRQRLVVLRKKTWCWVGS
tara:strand:+ start:194 stop:526 length:333 start_codon:yes stop_codon:yes gene_type:complete